MNLRRARTLATAGATLLALLAPSPLHARQQGWCGLWEGQEVDGHALPVNPAAIGGGCVPQTCQNQGPCDTPSLRDQFIPDTSTPILPIALQFTVVCDDSGSVCPVTAVHVAQQVEQLNLDFAEARFAFFYELQFVSDSRFVTVDNEAEEFLMKELYSISPESKLNVFVAHLPGTVLGDGVQPWNFDADPIHGGILLDPQGVAVQSFPSHVLTHEVGHALGLWHTYRGISEVPACSACYECPGFSDAARDLLGDFCSETMPTPFSSSCGNPPGFDQCNTSYFWNQNGTDYTNYMRDGLDDPSECMGEFESQQIGRMHCWFSSLLTGWIEPNPVIRVPSDFGSIGDAVTFAESLLSEGCTILLAPQTYSSASNRGITLTKNTSILGEGGASTTIIDCALQERAFIIQGAFGIDPVVTLEGLTIRRGRSSGSTGGGLGGGIDISDSGARVTLRDCRIEDCIADGRGGGIHFFGTQLLIDRCVIEDCQVLDPLNGEGGGVYIDGYQLAGVGLPEVRITNTVIARNQAAFEGGGLSVDPDVEVLELRNCTVVNNLLTAGFRSGGGAMLREGGASGSSWSIRNCIFWGNQVLPDDGALGDQLSFGPCCQCCGETPVTYCAIQGGPQNVSNLDQALQWGPGNRTTNPQFVDEATNFHLLAISPCINNGDPAYVALPGEQDMDREARVQQGFVDIGADERKTKIQQ